VKDASHGIYGRDEIYVEVTHLSGCTSCTIFGSHVSMMTQEVDGPSIDLSASLYWVRGT
jgi:hypothetical protein